MVVNHPAPLPAAETPLVSGSDLSVQDWRGGPRQHRAGNMGKVSREWDGGVRGWGWTLVLWQRGKQGGDEAGGSAMGRAVIEGHGKCIV